MGTLIDDLAARKAANEAASRMAWGAFVAKVATSTPDPDDVLKRLDEMGRSLEDLQEALELLERRKAWAETLGKGRKAESEYPGLLKQLEDGEAELKKLTEEHAEKMRPIQEATTAAQQAIGDAATAKQQLLQSVSREATQAATAAVDAKEAALHAERSELRKLISDKESWISRVSELASGIPSDQRAARVPDFAKIPEQRKALEKLQEQDAEINHRFEALGKERTQAMESLLLPETL